MFSYHTVTIEELDKEKRIFITPSICVWEHYYGMLFEGVALFSKMEKKPPTWIIYNDQFDGIKIIKFGLDFKVVLDFNISGVRSSMTTCLGKNCSFGLSRVPFVNYCQFMYLVISLLVLRAGYGILLHQFLIIAFWTAFASEESENGEGWSDECSFVCMWHKQKMLCIWKL